MSTAGKHALVALFYVPPLNKGYLVKVLDVARAKAGGFGKYKFVDADAFIGHADDKVDAAIIEGTVAPALADQIVAAYKAIGREAKVLSGSFQEEFEKYEAEAGVVGGVTNDPPANATDNATASRGSPMAHVETDGRNDPKPWQHTTGTSLDSFGLPLATTDRTGISAAEAVTGLDAQGQAVSARTAKAVADEQDRVGDAADGLDKTTKASQKAREQAAADEAEAAKKAADDADASAKAAAAEKAKADDAKASDDAAAAKAKADAAKAADAKGA